MTRSECPVIAATGGHVDDFMYGKQQERNCKITIAGRCGNTTISCNAASEWNTRKMEVFFCHRINLLMNWEKYRFQAKEEKKRTVQLRGLLGGLGWWTDRSATQRCDRTSTFQNWASDYPGHDRSQSALQNRECFAKRGILNVCDCLNCWVTLQWKNSPDEMARLVPEACVTDSKGLYDKMQHTVITPKGK